MIKVTQGDWDGSLRRQCPCHFVTQHCWGVGIFTFGGSVCCRKCRCSLWSHEYVQRELHKQEGRTKVDVKCPQTGEMGFSCMLWVRMAKGWIHEQQEVESRGGGRSQVWTEKGSKKESSGTVGMSILHCLRAECKFCPGMPGGHLIPGPHLIQVWPGG